jgi:hypothetical protein
MNGKASKRKTFEVHLKGFRDVAKIKGTHVDIVSFKQRDELKDELMDAHTGKKNLRMFLVLEEVQS